MNLDSFFTKGDSHKVCQDYAIHGETGQFVYAIVCDGCSSSEKVDLGARLLAESFVAVLRTVNPKLFQDLPQYPWHEQINHSIQKDVAAKLRTIKGALELEESAFDSTLLAVVLVKDHNQLLVFQWGDGRVTKIFKDNSVEQTQLIYSDNAPAYFSYSVWPDRGNQYNKMFGDQSTILKTTGKNDQPGQRQYMSVVDPTNLCAIHLTSDGIESIQDANENTVDMATEFTSFKSFEGEFVQRRMNRFLRNLRTNNGGHYDDLGVAAIAFDQNAT